MMLLIITSMNQKVSKIGRIIHNLIYLLRLISLRMDSLMRVCKINSLRTTRTSWWAKSSIKCKCSTISLAWVTNTLWTWWLAISMECSKTWILKKCPARGCHHLPIPWWWETGRALEGRIHTGMAIRGKNNSTTSRVRWISSQVCLLRILTWTRIREANSTNFKCKTHNSNSNLICRWGRRWRIINHQITSRRW